MNKFRDTLNKILDIVEYSGDKASFINQFIELSMTQLINNLMPTLTDEKQLEIKQRMGLVQDEAKIKIFNEYFSSEIIEKEIQQVLVSNLADYLRDISPLLNEEKRKKIKDVLEVS